MTKYLNIRYDGKMTDMIPAWAWQIATDYAYHIIDYCKVSDYLKEYYGRKRIKLEWVTIKEITSCPKIEEPRLKVISSIGSSENGKQYYAKTETIFTIANDTYRVEREILMWISECMSSVTKSNYKLFKGNILIMEIE